MDAIPQDEASAAPVDRTACTRDFHPTRNELLPQHGRDFVQGGSIIHIAEEEGVAGAGLTEGKEAPVRMRVPLERQKPGF